MLSKQSTSTLLRLLASGLLLGTAVAAAGCEERSPGAGTAKGEPTATSPNPRSSAAKADSSDALARTEAAAKRLGGALRSRLVDAMNNGGAATAVRVCVEEAPVITAQIQKETGASVGRSSLRPRNPASAPPAWVGAWLAAQGERKAEGVTGTSTVVDTPNGRMARVIKPIVIEAACLGCHGDPGAIAPEVAATLKAKFPSDRATGYAIGDLRGALWAEMPAGG